MVVLFGGIPEANDATVGWMLMPPVRFNTIVYWIVKAPVDNGGSPQLKNLTVVGSLNIQV